MSKALFLSLPLSGHVNPSLQVVRELTRRGDTVTVYSSERFAGQLEQAGASFRPYRDPFLNDLSQLPAQTHELSWLLMHTAANVLAQELDAFRDERPDYVIADSVAPWGQWVGRILDVPVVTSISTFAFNRHVMAFAAAHGVRPESGRLVLSKLRHLAKAFRLHRRLCRIHGVRGPGVVASVIGSSALNLVYTSRHFQPCADTFDERFRFVGPMTMRTETAPFDWERLRHSTIVYVSLGTIFNEDLTFYARCFEAFAGEDLQVVLSTGNNVSLTGLGAAPSNFVVMPHVPQLAVLRRASAFVTHGGMNSVSESLACGVPVVVIPQMGEQAIVGSQVQHLGAGLRLTKDATAGDLRGSVRRLLADDGFRRHAAVVRQSFQDAGGVDEAVDAIFAFTRPEPLQPCGIGTGPD